MEPMKIGYSLFFGQRYDAELAANNIEKVMDRFQLDENIIAYRGASRRHYENLNVGDSYEHKQFISTSIERSQAEIYLTKSKKINPIMMEIRIPKRTKCMYIGANGMYFNERELLLNRNLKYTVVSKDDKLLVLEVIM